MSQDLTARLAGRTALVTGAAHGMGREFALRLAAEGADVIALDLAERALDVGYELGTSDELDETVDLVRATGRRAVAVTADIRDREALARAVEVTAQDFPRLDILVCNAATIVYNLVLKTTTEQWDRVMGVNLTGTFNTVQAFAPRIIDGGRGGSIVIMSSVAGMKSLPFVGAYGATKHGLQGLTKSLAQELAHAGVRVNTVNPGPINTPMNADATLPNLLASSGEANATLFASTFGPLLPMPADGYIDPADVAGTVAWLASDDSRYTTGQAIPVDAGVVVR